MKIYKISRSYSLRRMRPLPGLLADERGKVALIVPVLLAVLTSFAGLVIDLGHLFVVRSTLQNAADSASLAATASLSYGPDEARNQAQLLAQYHAVDGTPVTLMLSDIELGTWDKDTKIFTVLAPDQEANADSVRVTSQRSTARNNPISLFFISIFGHETSDVNVVAVAYYQGGSLCGAIIGERLVKLNRSATTDSYRSDLGPYSPAAANQNGNICSCGDIELNSSAVVNGNATPGQDHSVNIYGSAYVTGSTEPGSCPSLPDVELGDIATNNDNGNIGLTDDGEHPFNHGPGLELDSSDGLTLPGGEYYFTSVEINSFATLRVAGPTVMYVADMFKVDSSSRIIAQRPQDLIVLVSSNADVTIGSGAEFHGVIYAPNSKAVLESGVSFSGSIMAHEVTLDSSAQVHYDESLDDMDLVNGVEFASGGTASSTLVQ